MSRSRRSHERGSWLGRQEEHVFGSNTVLMLPFWVKLTCKLSLARTTPHQQRHFSFKAGVHGDRGQVLRRKWDILIFLLAL